MSKSDKIVNTENKITWFIWKWNEGAIHKQDYMFDHIIVSFSWIQNNMNAQGNVVAGAYENYSDAILKCIEMNGDIRTDTCNV